MPLTRLRSFWSGLTERVSAFFRRFWPGSDSQGDDTSEPALLPPRPSVRVVTDSTAGLDPQVAAAFGIEIVPLRVISATGEEWAEGVDATAEALGARIAAGEKLSTSQPPPADFAATYQRLADDGASAIVSVHLSGQISGTVNAAELAARNSAVPVTVLDSETAAMALGFAALAGAECAAAGGTAGHVVSRVMEVADATELFFLVDSLEHLRRGGRISSGRALIGSALGVRPILTMTSEGVQLLQRVRTRRAAVERLLTLTVKHALGKNVAVAVHHVEAEARAQEVARRLGEMLEVDVTVTPTSAVLGAHVGPGSVAVALADLGHHQH